MTLFAAEDVRMDIKDNCEAIIINDLIRGRKTKRLCERI